MLDDVALTTTKDGRKLGIRIGIDSGPVVAGVIGNEKLSVGARFQPIIEEP